MTRLMILATLAVALSATSTSASAKCIMNYRRDQSTATTPAPGERRAITNTARQKVGTIYNPGHGRRVQIRDTSRRILFYIEKDGTITNPQRQKIGTVEK